MRLAEFDDELFIALKPMLAVTSGTFIMCSTPHGQRGQFHQTWTEGEGWERVQISVDQCPRLSKEFLAEQLRELGPQMFKQEFGCEFVADAECMFDIALINRAFNCEVTAIWV